MFANAKTDFDKMKIVRNKVNDNMVVSMFTASGSGVEFIEIFLELNLYRKGNTTSTYSRFYGLVQEEVKSIKQLKDLEKRLLARGFKDLDLI